MKVYLVFTGVDYEGDRLEGVFKTKKLAENFIELKKHEKIKETIETTKQLIKDKEIKHLINFWSAEVEDQDTGWRWNNKCMFYQTEEVKCAVLTRRKS